MTVSLLQKPQKRLIKRNSYLTEAGRNRGQPLVRRLQPLRIDTT